MAFLKRVTGLQGLPGCKGLSFVTLVTHLTLLTPSSSFGADKSGVSPNTISLPTGPGSIEGLGESFQPALNNGTLKYRVPLAVPPGTRGMTPALALAYESGLGNGPIGFGWTLPLAFVQRQTDKGIPRYNDTLQNGFDDDLDGQTDEPDEIDRFINEMKEQLVPQVSGFYFCENEGAFIRYRRNADHWEGTLPDGTRLRFGVDAQSRITDAVTGRVFCWLLKEQTDTRGNSIRYTYRSFAGEQNTNQKYLAGISYGPGSPPWSNFHFVTFTYEDRPDWFEDCRSGFVVRTGKRLREILIGTQGPMLSGHLAGDLNLDGAPDYLVRKYVLSYLQYDPLDSHWSLLGQVLPVGADGTSALPPVSFNYTLCHTPATLSATGHLIGGLDEPPQVMDNALVDLLELNGDGLPDVIKTERWGGAHVGFINLGESQTNGSRAIRWSAPREIASSDGLAWNVNLESTEPATHLADMDGDGLSDLVHHSAIGSVYYFPNAPTLSQSNAAPLPGWGRRKALTILDFAPPSPFGHDQNVKTADLDFDKRIDIIQSLSVANGVDYRIWFNRGEQRYSFSQTVSPPRGFLFSQAGVHIADFNGDRVPDIVSIKPTDVTVTAGLGHGVFAAPITVPLPGYTLDRLQVERAKLQDVTGDGLVDLVIERAVPGELWYWLNRGNYSLSTRKQITGLPESFSAQTAIRWADLNGNGTTDLIYADSSSSPRLRTIDLGRLMGCVPRPHLLTSIHNGIGRVEQIDVGDATAPTLVSRSVFDVGRTYEVMKGKLLRLSSEQEDGRVFWTDETTWTIPPRILYTGINGQTVNYAPPQALAKTIQEAGKGIERRLESEFAYDAYGNQTTNAEYGIVVGGDRTAFDDERITITEYALNLSNWMVRLPSRQVRMDENGAVSSRVETFYDDETFAANNWGTVSLGNLTLRREWIDPSDPTAFIAASRAKYDSYGNPTVLLDPLAVAAGATVDFTAGHARELVYDASFHAYPRREVIHVGSGNAPLVIEVDYDPGFGRITGSRDFNGNQTTYGYDSFGRLIHIVRPYDTLQYPTAEYDYVLAVPAGPNGVVNYVETRQLDKTPPSLPNPASRIDAYFVSRQFIDGLGRTLMTKHEAEADPATGQPRVVVKGAVLFNARAIGFRALNPFYTLASGSNLLSLLSFEDITAPGWQGSFHGIGQLLPLGLANAHQTQTEYDATLRPIRSANQDGTFRRTVYEPLVTKSYDENDNDPASPHFDTPMIFHHDGLGRQMRTDETARLNDDGTPAGELKTWLTQFAYDLNDNLTRITDSQSNVKLMAHDALGRMTFLNDPDRGVMRYVYDAASNLIETRDAKNQRITYTYDGANRILAEDYDDGRPPPTSRGTNSTPDVVYHYDAPLSALELGDGSAATARNTKGFLAHVCDLSGEEHTSFDQRSRAEYVVKRIADPVHQRLMAFTTRYSYDLADRLTRLIFPDNDEITYQYNDRTLLRHIPGGPSGSIVSNVTYLPAGQKEIIHYGNRVRTSYRYDARLRLTELRTQNPELGTELIHFAYTFNPANNISAIDDQRPASAAPAGDPRRNTQLFQYDDLDRLTRVQYSFHLPGAGVRNDGEINYRYDRIGNMLAQTSSLDHQENGLPIANVGQMESGGPAGRFNRAGRDAADPPGPHALTSIEKPESSIQSRSFPYDANGNMTDIDGLQCTWDFKDRLIAVENDTMRAEYTYDYTDRRIVKKVTPKVSLSPSGGEGQGEGAQSTTDNGPLTTIYVNKYFEVREHEQPTKYVWHGETRVARVTGSLSSNARVQRLRVFPGWNLVSLAVSSTNTLRQLTSLSASGVEGQGEVVSAAYKWNPQNEDYSLFAATEDLPAGTVLWLKTPGQATLRLTGAYTDPTNVPIAAAGGYYPCAGLEVLTATNALPANATLWRFDNDDQQWRVRLAGDHPLGSDALPLQRSLEFLAPGESLFIQANAPAELQAPDAALRIRFYHQDHLGSSSDGTDMDGNLVEETSFYPFGHARIEHRPRNITESYRFTQNETDRESGLQYFEARFLASHLARFIRCDPLGVGGTPERMMNPQRSHPYAYTGNNPLARTDPLGLDGWELVAAGAWNTVESQLGEAVDFVSEHPVKTVIGVITAPATAGPAIIAGVGGGAYEATSDLLAAATGERFGVSGGVTHYTEEQRYEQLGSGLVKGTEVVVTIVGARSPAPKFVGPEAFAKTQPGWVVGKTQPSWVVGKTQPGWVVGKTAPVGTPTVAGTWGAQEARNAQWAAHVFERLGETRAAREQVLKEKGWSAAADELTKIFDAADELLGRPVLPGD
jgi:RHS repeat-associated protein